jgi:hypothetical protein
MAYALAVVVVTVNEWRSHRCVSVRVPKRPDRGADPPATGVLRGVSEGLVWVLFYQVATTPTLVYDYGDALVPGQQAYISELGGDEPAGYFLRILTSSSDLIPSVVFEPAGTEGAAGFPLSYACIQPGDFAVFDLPATFIPPGRPPPPNA